MLAIEHLHERGIIHRNICPNNVIFDQDGHCLLTGFSVAKEGIGMIDLTNSFVGSTIHLAPEMLNKSGHTRSIDWYMLGALIYEMLVGVPPYFDTDKAKLFENIKSGPLKLPF